MSKSKNRSRVQNVGVQEGQGHADLFQKPEKALDREIARPVVISATVPMFDIAAQNGVINEHEISGYQHYETVYPSGTGEVLFRFRLKL